MTSTKIHKGWLIKTGIYFVAMVGLGLWGLYDGLIAYPNRGKGAAEFLEMQYLTSAGAAGALSRAAVDDPGAELKRLQEQERTLKREIEQAQDSFARQEKQTALNRLDWLTALHRIGWLRPEHTRMTVYADPGASAPDASPPPGAPDPSRRLAYLEDKWKNRTPPKPLSAFDIPAQWLIAAAGLGAGAWILFLVLMVAAKKYRWNPESLALTLPGGRSITPSDIREVDKRKWDKYLVFLQLKDGSPEVRLDLLRYTPLEEWVLEMERHTEGYEAPAPSAPAEAVAEAGAPDEAARG